MGLCDIFAPEPRKRRKYWQEKNIEVEAPNDDIAEDKQKLKLIFSIFNTIDKDNYFLKVVEEGKNNIYTSEVVVSHNNRITFNTFFIFDNYFEKKQNIIITLIHNKKVEGEHLVGLEVIAGSPQSCYTNSFGNNINFRIQTEVIKNINPRIKFSFQVNTLQNYNFYKRKNKFYFLISKNDYKIYSSESISDEGGFESVTIPTFLIENGFKITFYDCNGVAKWSKNDTINNFKMHNDTSIYEGVRIDQFIFDFLIKIQEQNYTLEEYLEKGISIKLDIGIDFNSSNMHKDSSTPLPYVSSGKYKNDYEEAIGISASIIDPYMKYNKSYSVYGFGGINQGQNNPNLCFNVNFQEDPKYNSIEGVLQAYRTCLKRITLNGPSRFSPLIQKVIDDIKLEENNLKYHILLIVTNGVINDLQETINVLVEGSFLPLSVVIVGVGNGNFNDMITLDGDNIPLTNSQKMKRLRDLVQFVPFNKYRNNETELRNQVLEEIPRQVTQYYMMNKIYPENISKYYNNKKKKKLCVSYRDDDPRLSMIF